MLTSKKLAKNPNRTDLGFAEHSSTTCLRSACDIGKYLSPCTNNIIRLHHSTMDMDAVYCYIATGVCHDCEPSKTAEPIETPFGLWTRAGPRNHV